MFMVKDEYENIKNLVKVKLRVNRKNFGWFPAIAAFMYLISLGTTIASILSNEGIRHYGGQDFSVSFFFGLIVALAVMMMVYTRMNNYMSVFPQTNNSRFIASQLVTYIIAVFVGLILLALHLISYGVIKLISLSVENVYLALGFDFGFLLIGFLTFLIYSFLSVAIIDLVGVALRKWTYYAFAAMLTLASLAFINMTAAAQFISGAAAFLTNEQSFGLFAVKAAVLWLAITAVSLIINKHTVYYKSSNNFSDRKIVIFFIAIATAVMIFVWLIGFTILSAGRSSVNVSPNPQDNAPNRYNAQYEETRIDVSHLPKGSSLNIAGDSGAAIAKGETIAIGNRNSAVYISGTTALGNIQADTIVISYRAPFYHISGVNLFDYANPKVAVYLVGDTLHIEYSVDDVSVVILPIWGFARQFAGFKDSGFVIDDLLGYSGGGSMNAVLHIDIE